MECSQVYVTPKRKFNRNTTCSPSDASPVEKRAKESKSPDVRSPGDEDQVMAALNLSEGVAEKFDLILAKLCSLDSKMEDLNTTVKSLQSKLSFVEIDIASVKDKQKNLDEKFSHMETNSIFVDERINQLQSNLEKSKKEVDECHQKILYLEAYSRRENLKFEGIAEASHNNAASTRSENTEEVLVDFLENVLGIENAKNIEFQRIHRLGKPKNDSGDGNCEEELPKKPVGQLSAVCRPTVGRLLADRFSPKHRLPVGQQLVMCR